MSDLNNDLEGMIGDMGMSVSDQAPESLEQPATQLEETPAKSVQDEPQPVTESVQEVQQSTQ